VRREELMLKICAERCYLEVKDYDKCVKFCKNMLMRWNYYVE